MDLSLWMKSYKTNFSMYLHGTFWGNATCTLKWILWVMNMTAFWDTVPRSLEEPEISHRESSSHLPVRISNLVTLLSMKTTELMLKFLSTVLFWWQLIPLLYVVIQNISLLHATLYARVYIRPGQAFADQELLLIFPESRGPPHILIF
jgi:hypothetical protein